MKIRGSYLWAGAILIAVAGWVASGLLTDAEVSGPAANGDAAGEEQLPSVRVATITAGERRATLVVRGRTEADERVELRAETAGQVRSMPFAKGTFVAKGAVLCEIDLADRNARRAEARAAVDQAQLDYDAAVKLKEQGFTAANEEAARKARLDAARAGLMLADIDLERTQTKAPFDGIVEVENAKPGVWLAVGEACVTLVDLDPMLIVGQVSERDVGKIDLGMEGTARLVTGQTVEGTVGYIATSADASTRTFRVELHVANAERSLKDGVTAEIDIPLPATTAHRFSPALLTLSDDGRLGVRTVDVDGVVHFEPVEIVADDRDGVWVTGLADEVTVITVGQDYVSEGQRVRVVPENGAAGG